MPTYEFICKDCDEIFEEIRTVAARNDPHQCPKCQKKTLRVLISHQVQTRVAKSELTTDFGDGSGERTYSRHEYIEKCKALDRQPVGLVNMGRTKKRKGA